MPIVLSLVLDFLPHARSKWALRSRDFLASRGRRRALRLSSRLRGVSGRDRCRRRARGGRRASRVLCGRDRAEGAVHDEMAYGARAQDVAREDMSSKERRRRAAGQPYGHPRGALSGVAASRTRRAGCSDECAGHVKR